MSTSTLLLFFFFNDTATTEIYTLSLHDALPISSVVRATTMLASPDQIIRSTATNSTCRVATTLLGVHRPAVRLTTSGVDTATGQAHSSGAPAQAPSRALPRAREESGGGWSSLRRSGGTAG